MKLSLTDKAAKEIKRLMADQNIENGHLRLRVVGGGCAGFSHKLDIDTEVNEKTDTVHEINGVKVIVDKRSALYVEGATIDFHDDLNKMGFSVSNPASKGTCGCGSSFSM